MPTTIKVPSAWKPPIRLSLRKPEAVMGDRAEPADAGEEGRVTHSRHDQAQGSAAMATIDSKRSCEQEQRSIVERGLAEQHAQEIDTALHIEMISTPAESDIKIEDRRAGHLDYRIARDTAGQQGDGDSGDESAQSLSPRKRKAGNQIADGRCRKNRVRNGIAADSATQHQKDADRRHNESARQPAACGI